MTASIAADGRTLIFFEHVNPGGSGGLRLMAASPVDGAAQRLQVGNSAFDVAAGWLSGEVLVVDGVLTVRVSDLAAPAIGEPDKAGPDAPSTALERR